MPGSSNSLVTSIFQSKRLQVTIFLDYAASKIFSAKTTLVQRKDRVLAAVNNATSCATGFFSQLSVQNGGICGQDVPQSVYQKTLAKFQAASFEQERQALKNEILKLADGLKRELKPDGGSKSYGTEIGEERLMPKLISKCLAIGRGVGLK